jgi:hypothetical protein
VYKPFFIYLWLKGSILEELVICFFQEGAATYTIPEKQAQKSARFHPLSLAQTAFPISRFIRAMQALNYSL